MNILLPLLQNYFKEMMSLEGKIFVLDSFVKNFRDDIKRREKDDSFLMGSSSAFRDISKFNAHNTLQAISTN
jgi:hypothetical protein